MIRPSPTFLKSSCSDGEVSTSPGFELKMAIDRALVVKMSMKNVQRANLQFILIRVHVRLIQGSFKAHSGIAFGSQDRARLVRLKRELRIHQFVRLSGHTGSGTSHHFDRFMGLFWASDLVLQAEGLSNLRTQ